MASKQEQQALVSQCRNGSREAQVAQLYLDNPTPEFRQALNIACESFIRIDPKRSRNPEGRNLAVVSSTFYAVELLKRCPGPLEVAGLGSFEAESFVEQARGWAWGELVPTSFPLNGEYSWLVLAEPDRCDVTGGDRLKLLLADLREHASPGATLTIIASTFLRSYLPAWHRNKTNSDWQPAKYPLAASQVPALLRRTGWRVEYCLGFHGPRSITWTFLARLADSLGRPDWTDRARFAMRNSYKEKGSLWKFSPLTLICAHPI
jgi:hypothetical protein